MAIGNARQRGHIQTLFAKSHKFEKAFDWDRQFMKKYEHITEAEYQRIKQELIAYWQKKSKSKGGLKRKN